MFIYHIHFDELSSFCDDPYKYDIYFQAKGMINLWEMVGKMSEIVNKMNNDEESELYEEYCDYDWYEQIDKAFDMVVEDEYHDAERIEVFTVRADI